MGKELTLILGGGPRSGAAASTGKAVAGDIKLEPASGEEGVFYSQGGDDMLKRTFIVDEDAVDSLEEQVAR